MPEIDQTISHYRIIERLGQGGMGEVFLAHDTSLDRKVALKFLPLEMQQGATAHERFIREARSAAALDHPYICHINEVAESDSGDFIAMEYVHGRSLKDRLEQGPLPPFVLDALIAANALGPGKGLPSLIMTKNLGKVRNKGLERNVEARLNRYLTANTDYWWQACPEPKDFDISLINLPPTNRFNAGLSLDYKRYLGNVSVGYVGSAYWNDVITAIYSGPTRAYTVVNASGGIRWGGGKYITMPKVADLANTPVQNHVWGDILKRQITGKIRMRF